jgi:beta-glucanase (GH16 family)
MRAPDYNPQQLGGSIVNPASMRGADWHVYAFEWTSSSIAFSVDGLVYYQVNTSSMIGLNPFTDEENPFYLLIDLALGWCIPDQNLSPA